MEGERSLLQQIGDKERELGLHLKEIAGEADRQVEAARQEAAERVAEADESGKRDADRYREKERAATAAETKKIKKEGERNAGEIAMRGEPNVARAAEEIVRRVALK